MCVLSKVRLRVCRVLSLVWCRLSVVRCRVLTLVLIRVRLVTRVVALSLARRCTPLWASLLSVRLPFVTLLCNRRSLRCSVLSLVGLAFGVVPVVVSLVRVPWRLVSVPLRVACVVLVLVLVRGLAIARIRACAIIGVVAVIGRGLPLAMPKVVRLELLRNLSILDARTGGGEARLVGRIAVIQVLLVRFAVSTFVGSVTCCY